MLKEGAKIVHAENPMTDGRRETVNPAPLVAIVTPAYIGEAFPAEIMESVQRQTYPNIVHVVLDNASTDGTAEVISRFQNQETPLIVGRNEQLLPMDEN